MFGFNRQDVRLTFNLFKMNVRDRYLGSSLGSFWAVANPFFMLALYTFVFGFVFKSKLPGASTTLSYVTWLISGYGPWIAINEAIMASATSVVGASGLVKNLAFKTELLPISAALVGLISLAVSLGFCIVLLVIQGQIPNFLVLWIPIIIAIQFLLVIAMGIWLSALNVFIRDITSILPNVLVMIMFGTPIFYPIHSMPGIIQKISFANPFFIIVDSYRKVLLDKAMPNSLALLYVAIIALLLFWTGLKSFRRAKGHFDSAL